MSKCLNQKAKWKTETRLSEVTKKAVTMVITVALVMVMSMAFFALAKPLTTYSVNLPSTTPASVTLTQEQQQIRQFLRRKVNPTKPKSPTKAAKLHAKMKAWDTKFDKLSKKNRAKFIRYWVKWYQKHLHVRKSRRVSGSKAVGIAISETSLGKAGVGRSKNNLFGLKLNDRGKFVSRYPRYKLHRRSVKALVLFYSRGLEWHLWKGKSSKLGK